MPSYPAAPPVFGLPQFGAVSTWSHAPTVVGFGAAATATNWPAANLILYMPIEVPTPFLITKLGWWNGGVVAGNMDLGVYTLAGTLLVSAGLTAQAGTNALQVVDITDYLLMPGNYYIGLLNTSTGRIAQYAISAARGQACGLAQQASATLPAAWTPATYAQAYYPLAYLLNDTRIA